MGRLSERSANPNSRRDRPSLAASYGVAQDHDGMLSWGWVEEQLRQARSYWVATTRPDGRPQVIPVWGIWLDDMLMFGTSTGSRKARNLAGNPAIAIHLESGDDVVIVEGITAELHDAALFERYSDAYDAKYAIRPDDGTEADGITYAVRPLRVLAWLERDFLKTPTRWTFARD